MPAVDPSISSFLLLDNSDVPKAPFRLWGQQVEASLRERLQASRTYFVRIDGSDANTGLVNSAGGAFLTIQKAIDTACALDLGIYGVTIQVGAGTFGGYVPKPYVGTGPIVITGVTGSTIIDPSGGISVQATDAGTYNIGGQKFQNCLFGMLSQGRTTLNGLAGLEFGSCTNIHLFSAAGAQLVMTQPYTISGGAPSHWGALDGGLLQAAQLTGVTLTGTPNFSYYFAQASGTGHIKAFGTTFTGTATGNTALITGLSLLNLNGAAIGTLPGNGTLTTASGGLLG